MYYDPMRSRVHLILEYVKGKELFDYICEGGAMQGKEIVGNNRELGATTL
jgi:hypothetical protein